jgi:hypothetical protein
MTKNRQAAIGFIFVTLLIDTMGWGLIINRYARPHQAINGCHHE